MLSHFRVNSDMIFFFFACKPKVALDQILLLPRTNAESIRFFKNDLTFIILEI
jgi:hypothetical protein